MVDNLRCFRNQTNSSCALEELGDFIEALFANLTIVKVREYVSIPTIQLKQLRNQVMVKLCFDFIQLRLNTHLNNSEFGFRQRITTTTLITKGKHISKQANQNLGSVSLNDSVSIVTTITSQTNYVELKHLLSVLVTQQRKDKTCLLGLMCVSHHPLIHFQSLLSSGVASSVKYLAGRYNTLKPLLSCATAIASLS